MFLVNSAGSQAWANSPPPAVQAGRDAGGLATLPGPGLREVTVASSRPGFLAPSHAHARPATSRGRPAGGRARRITAVFNQKTTCHRKPVIALERKDSLLPASSRGNQQPGGEEGETLESEEKRNRGLRRTELILLLMRITTKGLITMLSLVSTILRALQPLLPLLLLKCSRLQAGASQAPADHGASSLGRTRGERQDAATGSANSAKTAKAGPSALRPWKAAPPPWQSQPIPTPLPH